VQATIDIAGANALDRLRLKAAGLEAC